MVYGIYNYNYWGLYTNIHITGGPHIVGLGFGRRLQEWGVPQSWPAIDLQE